MSADSSNRRSDPDAIHIGTRKVRKGGQVTIPKETRERYGIGLNDEVDLVLLVPGYDEEVRCDDCAVIGHGQVTIPVDVRREYAINVGSYLDLTVIPRTNGDEGGDGQ